MDEKKTNELRERVRSFKERSKFSYRILAEKIGIPYSSFRNFMYGVKISVERYEMISENLDHMESCMPW